MLQVKETASNKLFPNQFAKVCETTQYHNNTNVTIVWVT